jgi:hypothetical protein
VPRESAGAGRARGDRRGGRVRRAHVRGGAADRGAGRARRDRAGYGATRRGNGGRDRARAAARGRLRTRGDVHRRAPARRGDRGGSATGRGVPGARLRHLPRRTAGRARRLGRGRRLQRHAEVPVVRPSRSARSSAFAHAARRCRAGTSM